LEQLNRLLDTGFRLASHQEMAFGQFHKADDVLSGYFAFAALPRVELPAFQYVQSLLVAAKEVQESHKFQEQIFARVNNKAMLLQKSETRRRRSPCALFQEVTLEQDAGVARIQFVRAPHGPQRFRRRTLLVEINQ